MENFVNQILAIFMTQPGNLVYRVILSFSIFGALQASFNIWQGNRDSRYRRMVNGLSLLLSLQILLFAGTALTWQGLFSSDKLLPPIDQVVSQVSVLVIIWLWAYPKAHRRVDAIMLLLTLLVTAFGVYSLIWWNNQPDGLYYIGTMPEIIATTTTIGMLAIGLILLLILRPASYGFGLGMISILLTGYVLLWLFPPSNNHNAAIVSLAEMIAYPLLLALPQRFITTGSLNVELEDDQSKVDRSLHANLLKLNTVYKLSIHTSLEKYCEELVRTIAALMEADICLCLLPGNGNTQLRVPAGYNLKKVTKIEGFSLDNLKSPILANMMKLGKPVKVPASSSPPDLVWLARLIGESGVGSLLAVTANDEKNTPLLGIVLLTPYSKKDWSSEDQKTLTELAIAISPYLGQINQSSQLQTELATQIEQNQALQRKSDLDHAELEVLRKELSGRAPPIDIEHYERELRLALVEVAQLRATLADYDRHVIERRMMDDDHSISKQTIHELGSVVQEFRQPLSSAIGYTDLLLGESIGILGALQRKFLERIRTSTVKIGNLVDELEQITVIEKLDDGSDQETINLNTLIDDVLGGMMEKFSRKNISLRVDIPDQLPLIHADSDAIQQIFIHLLNHAGNVTENNGIVSFNVSLEVSDQKPSYVLVQVRAGNDGVDGEKGAYIFPGIKRGEEKDLEGSGEKTSGLSIVKTLVEAQGGRTWVETKYEMGTTYSVLLPIGQGR